MTAPNWLTALTTKQGILRKILLFGGLAIALMVCFALLQRSGTAKAITRTRATVTPNPGDLASRDMAITGMARSNKQASLQAAEEIKNLKQQLEMLKRQQAATAAKPSSSAGLTPEQVRQIAAQQIALNKQSQVAPYVPPVKPWQRVGPENPPVKPVAKAPKPKFVTIPAGSTAKAKLSDGLAWIADKSARYHTIRIQDIHTPNNQAIPLGECHVVMQSQLEIASEVVARLPIIGDVLSCVLPNGDAMEVAFKGYAATSDNIQGLEAKVFSNDLDILKEFGKAAIPAVLARAIDGVTRISTTPLGTVSQRSGSALSDAFSAMSDFYLDNARVYARKILWIPPHQEIYVYFRRAVQLDGVTPQLLTASTRLNRKDWN